jgi:hypothetical protein
MVALLAGNYLILNFTCHDKAIQHPKKLHNNERDKGSVLSRITLIAFVQAHNLHTAIHREIHKIVIAR